MATSDCNNNEVDFNITKHCNGRETTVVVQQSDKYHICTLGTQCAPLDAQGGKYIMYPTTSQGDMPNNYFFSPCSKNTISVS